MSVEQYKEYRKMESDNEYMRQALQQLEARQQGERTYQEWMQQGEELKEKYGLSDFSLRRKHRIRISVRCFRMVFLWKQHTKQCILMKCSEVPWRPQQKCEQSGCQEYSGKGGTAGRRSCQFSAGCNCKSKCISINKRR